MVGLVSASCPYSGYVPGMKGVVVSKWVDINTTECLGVCPKTVLEEQNAWKPIEVNMTYGTMLQTEEQFYEDYLTSILIRWFIELPKILLS